MTSNFLMYFISNTLYINIIVLTKCTLILPLIYNCHFLVLNLLETLIIDLSFINGATPFLTLLNVKE